ncbi:WD40-repeat-containing domain protein [Flammula alnicola]|nr:WD40-repeat-containing domain protein [Flammula alnicola]
MTNLIRLHIHVIQDLCPSRKIDHHLSGPSTRRSYSIEMASTKKSSASHSKPPKETYPILSSFSPDGTLFAFVTLAVDKHRLRVYNTLSARAVAEHTVDSGRVSTLTWKKEDPIRSIKDDAEAVKEVAVVVLGLSDGVVLFFSPSHSKINCTLTHPTSTFPILSVAIGLTSKSLVWTSSADSSIRLWDVQKNAILKTWKHDDRIPSTFLSVRPTGEDDRIDLLVAHHHIRLLADASAEHNPTQTKPKEIASFTGHASSINALLWTNSDETSTRFFSSAEADRFIYVWDIDGASSNEKPVASISLDSDVRTFKLGAADLPQQSLIALSTSGKLSFIPIPSDLPHIIGNDSSKILSLLPRSTLPSVSKNNTRDPLVVDFVSIPGDAGSICVVRLVQGIRPVFDVVRYLDANGNYIPTLNLSEVNQGSITDGPQLIPNKRYAEAASLEVGSGFDIDQGEGDEDSAAQHELDGSLQVDLAELSLGQRLTAVAEGDPNPVSDMIPANSLTRTLIQALHSSDSRLLEMCLAHSDPVLIRNTVQRLPPQLAIPLITVCVERLGRGPRAANMKDLVARLSGLHATLTARLSLHDSLLSLSGRLDMVLSQVEIRASTTPASLAPLRDKTGQAKKGSLMRRYVEGETDSGEDDAKMDVEVEASSDDEGSIEDIELGGDSENEASEEDGFSDSDDGDGAISKFIDDEAEEDYSDEEDEDESE